MPDEFHEHVALNIVGQIFPEFEELPESIKTMVDGAICFQFELRQWQIARQIEYGQTGTREAEEAIVRTCVRQVLEEAKKSELSLDLQEDEEMNAYLETLIQKISMAFLAYTAKVNAVIDQAVEDGAALGLKEQPIRKFLAEIELSFLESL